MKFYRHPSTGHYNDYFGNVSVPVETTVTQYYTLKVRGFRVTKAPSSYTIGQVHIKSQIEAGSHPNSFKVDELRERYNLKGFLRNPTTPRQMKVLIKR